MAEIYNYMVFEDGTAVIFSKGKDHSQKLKEISETEVKIPKSAGVCRNEPGIGLMCYGESETLELKPLEGDKEAIRKVEKISKVMR